MGGGLVGEPLECLVSAPEDWLGMLRIFCVSVACCVCEVKRLHIVGYVWYVGTVLLGTEDLAGLDWAE